MKQLTLLVIAFLQRTADCGSRTAFDIETQLKTNPTIRPDADATTV
jgi:hypothetical protein